MGYVSTLTRNQSATAHPFISGSIAVSQSYRQVEEDARVNQRGLWQARSIASWDWRHRNNRIVIPGAFSVPIDAQKYC